MIRAALVAVLVLAVTACGGEDAPACETAPAEVVETIAGGDTASIETTGRTATMPTDEGHLVAVEFIAGGEPTVGVWWTDGAGMVSSVDHLAQSFTSWPAGPLSPGDRRVGEVADCLA